MKKLMNFLLLILIFSGLKAQNLSPVLGVSDERPEVYAFTNASIFVDCETQLKAATLLIKRGRIISVGKNVTIPDDAVIQDLKGKYIYPSFIDLYSEYGIDAGKTSTTERSYMSKPIWDSKVDGPYYWNDAIKPYVNAVNSFHVDNKSAKELRDIGFGSVVTQKHDGILRGTSALVSLKNDDEEEVVLSGKVSTGYSLKKGTSQMNYPNSLMGVIALIRQTIYDAKWHEHNNKTFYDESLESINKTKGLPAILAVNNKLELLRLADIGTEIGIPFIFKGSGDEYQLIEEVAKKNASLILPLNFPAAPDVEDTYESILIPYKDLKHWELAPSNPAKAANSKIEFAFTADGLKDKKQFRKNLLKAVKYGLSKEMAIKALTEIPAKMIKMNDLIGTLETNKIANFLITSGDYFEEDCVVYENWVQGEKYIIKKKDELNLAGKYKLEIGDKLNYEAQIGGKPGAYSLTLKSGKKELKGKIKVYDNLVNLTFSDNNKWIRLSGWVNGKNLTGSGVLTKGEKTEWTLIYKGASKNDKKKTDKKKETPDLGKVVYPFVAYGNSKKPDYHDILIKNATVWTLEEEGIKTNTDVLISNGKIAKIGKELSATGVLQIDGSGLHLTPGIIDEHSHIGLNGTNEATHAVTSEVRMRDVLNSEDISFYRQLSGGVTCAQLLHGSANPIGGRSVIVKFRWGATPEEMVVKNQVGFLKHALGENVKQSRYPSFIANRFPQSRMGVEQSIRDAYLRAQEYKAKLEKQEDKNLIRKDLQLEAIVDVLNKKSFMGIHTYVQSETNMIIKLAQEFGVKPHTLIHNTEGYKVADQMKESGAAGSLFADWWAFKFEVYDAIPYNAAILTKHDVLSCIHSDNAELARRLNQEAGKAVKYGGLSEEDALKLVTLNPAKILHLDNRMGSIKVGKDADLVLWTDHPLSIYATAAKTFVDGIVYYDMEEDKNKYQAIQKERARIINKILAEGGDKKEGESKKKSTITVNDQFIYDDEDASDYSDE